MKKLLVIDDDSLIRSAVSESFKDTDEVQVIEAKDGEAGLELALSEKPALILLDENMPKLSGQEVIEKLRNDEWGSNVPIVAFTVNDDIGLMNKKLQAGVTEYLDKSTSSPDAVAEVLKKYLS